MMRTSRARCVAGVIALLIYASAGLQGVGPASAATGTFGSSSIGSTTATPSAGYKIASAFSLGEAATTESFSFYAQGGANAQRFVPAVYRASASGDPAGLVAIGSEVVIAANQPAGWVTAPLSAASLTPGSYYLTLLTGATTRGAFVYYSPASNGAVYNKNAYPTPSADFGAFSREARRWSFYVTYTTGGDPAPPANTAPPAITGTAEVGATLTASTGTWSGSPTSFAYQWSRCDTAGAACTTIPGAGTNTYTPVAGDAGSTVRVTVTATNTVGSGTADSAPTAVIRTAPQTGKPVNTVPPAITGTPQRSSTLSASTGEWSNNPTSFTYQWKRCNAAGSPCLNLLGETGPTYVPIWTDMHQRNAVEVTATNSFGSTVVRSAVTDVIADGPPPGPPIFRSSKGPLLRGTAVVGHELTAISGELLELGLVTFQWRRCSATGASCSSIAGATADTYTPTTADVARTVRVRATATNSAGSVYKDSPVSQVVVAPTPGSRAFGALDRPAPRAMLVASGTLVGSVFEVIEPGTAKQFWFYGAGNYIEPPTSGVQTFTPALYAAGADGTPTTLLASGTAVSVGKGQGWGWIVASLPDVPLGPGRYVVALLAGSGSNVMIGYEDGASGAGLRADGVGTTLPSTWPSASATDQRWAFRVAFSPANGSAPPAPVNVVAPDQTGAQQQGSRLVAHAGAWDGATNISYAWARCGADGGSCTTIPGATTQTYVLTVADVGSTVRAQVTGHNSGGSTMAQAPASGVVTAAPAGSLTISVGYANNATLPSTWRGSPGVNFVGTPPIGPTSINLEGWDAGAVLFTNPTNAAITIDSVTVDIGALRYSLWSNVTVPAQGSAIVTQTQRFNFDSSEAGGFGCFDSLPDIPIIHVTINGETKEYYDPEQILNTDGKDTGVCAYVGRFTEEGHDWVVVS